MGKLKFPAARSYLWSFSLQAGVVISCVIGMTLIITSAVVSIFSPNEATLDQSIVQYLSFFLYVCVMFIGFLLTFLAAFWEHIDVMQYGINVITGGLIYWIVLCVVCFIPNLELHMWLCMEGRCPDVQYLYDARWRYLGYDCPPDKEVELEYETIKVPEQPDAAHYLVHSGNLLREVLFFAKYPGCEVGQHVLIFISALFAIAYLIFLLYSLYVAISYRQELLEEFELLTETA